MTVQLGLAPAIALQKRISQAALFTGLMIYLEGVAALALLTQQVLSVVALIPIVLVMGAQFRVVRRPVQLLVRDRLVASYRLFFLLALVFVSILGLGSRKGDQWLIATLLGAFVVAVTAWPTVAAMRAARTYRSALRAVASPAVLLACLSFDVRTTLAAKLRSFGGDRVRWAAPFLIASLALAASLVALGLLQRALGFNLGAIIGQASGVVALWTFYRSMRHAKLRASVLRERDTRPPVLILREFDDDVLMTPRFHPGRSFEHFFTGELDRIGPTISVGRPGERLAPLGASRDYLADPDWKRAVGTMIEDAAVTAFLLGDSESLLWEFRKTVATRGKDRALVIVPPLRDRAELGRRWKNFVEATADIIGTGLPAELPEEPVLAFFFAHDDIIVFVGRDLGRSRSRFPKVAPDYRLALRLFGYLLHERPASARDVEAFMRQHLPMVAVRVVTN
jgi:hypothetical protein